MTEQFANWTHDPETSVPYHHPHIGTFVTCNTNQSGRTVYFADRDTWISTDTHYRVEP